MSRARGGRAGGWSFDIVWSEPYRCIESRMSSLDESHSGGWWWYYRNGSVHSLAPVEVGVGEAKEQGVLQGGVLADASSPLLHEVLTTLME